MLVLPNCSPAGAQKGPLSGEWTKAPASMSCRSAYAYNPHYVQLTLSEGGRGCIDVQPERLLLLPTLLPKPPALADRIVLSERTHRAHRNWGATMTSNSTKTLTLTEFLLARIAEDEADEGLFAHTSACASNKFPDPSSWDPGECDCGADARRLAECEAKRLAIEAAWGDHVRIEGEWGRCQSQAQMGAENDNPEVVEALASVYADHPDYREEWRA